MDLSGLSDNAFDALLRPPPVDEAWRKAYIRARGLPARLRLTFLGDLLALVVEPLPGFTHLVREALLPEALRRYGPYHISLCFREEAQEGLVVAAAAAWDGWEGTLWPRYLSEAEGGGYFEVGGWLAACPHLQALHSGGWYRDRALHISM